MCISLNHIKHFDKLSANGYDSYNKKFYNHNNKAEYHNHLSRIF